MDIFSEQRDWESLLKICAEHSHVAAPERSAHVGLYPDHLHSMLLLQQKIRTLESEIQERDKIQAALREREAELTDSLENATIGMQWIAANGTILWANQAQLAFTGYARDEYQGQHISEFHVDPHVIEDILLRLNRGEELRGYEARLRCKNGSARHIRIDSNAFAPNGQFAFTRCFITDIAHHKLELVDCPPTRPSKLEN